MQWRCSLFISVGMKCIRVWLNTVSWRVGSYRTECQSVVVVLRVVLLGLWCDYKVFWTYCGLLWDISPLTVIPRWPWSTRHAAKTMSPQPTGPLSISGCPTPRLLPWSGFSPQELQKQQAAAHLIRWVPLGLWQGRGHPSLGRDGPGRRQGCLRHTPLPHHHQPHTLHPAHR